MLNDVICIYHHHQQAQAQAGGEGAITHNTSTTAAAPQAPHPPHHQSSLFYCRVPPPPPSMAATESGVVGKPTSSVLPRSTTKTMQQQDDADDERGSERIIKSEPLLNTEEPATTTETTSTADQKEDNHHGDDAVSAVKDKPARIKCETLLSTDEPTTETSADKEDDNHDAGVNTTNSKSGDWRQRAGWPTACKVVVVDRLCGEAVLRGANVFVRGVLVTDRSVTAGDAVAVYADVSKATLTRGMSLQRYSCLKHGRRCVLVGTGVAECDRAAMFTLSRGVAVRMRRTASPHDWQPPSLNEFVCATTTTAKFMLQNVPSALVARALVGDLLLLDPRKNSRTNNNNDIHDNDSSNNNNKSQPLQILDMCAAPGGKASHVASLLQTATSRATTTAAAIIVACDKSRSKVVAMRSLFERLGVLPLPSSDNNDNNVKLIPLVLNTTRCVLSGSPSSSVAEILETATPSSKDRLLQGISGFPPESFDRILLDPPCSALGLRPRLSMDNCSLADLEAAVRYQRQFVDAAVALLRVGGVVTYSTCTIHVGENEHAVRYILETYPDCMELVPVFDFEDGTEKSDNNNDDKRLSSLGGPGLPSSGLTAEQCARVRRFDPADSDDDTMGFFLAKFRKTRTTHAFARSTATY